MGGQTSITSTTGEREVVVLINEPPEATNEPGAAASCFWWRQGRVGCSLFANTFSSGLGRQIPMQLASGRGDPLKSIST